VCDHFIVSGLSHFVSWHVSNDPHENVSVGSIDSAFWFDSSYNDFFFFFFCCAGYQTQGLGNTRQVFYY
jgi:hypothetical protein